MRTFSPLWVAALVALPAANAARAQQRVAPVHNAGTNNSMAQQQKAMEAQLKQQQKLMEQQLKNEQKMMQQQQQAMQKQALQQQKAMQQAALHEQKTQQHAMQQQAKAALGSTNAAASANAAAVTPGAAHHTAAKTVHHVTTTVHHPITYWRTWPLSTSASYRHLESLKRHLDSIAMKSVPTTSQKIGLKSALVNVIENSPHPASSHMQTFANHLAESIASRTTPAIDTREMALQLRVMVNNVHMTPVDLDSALTQHQALMLGAGVPQSHVGVISDDLRYLVGETQTKALR